MPTGPVISQPTEAAVASAADRLRAGDVVAFPTETVYGLGADTFNVAAIRRAYELKGRPADNPLIAHVIGAPQAARLVTQWDDRCERLARRFWPGPLTIVLPRADAVPAEATAGRPTIAVRCPAHPIARRLLAAFGSPISAPSANRSGHVSPTRAEHVAADFADVDDLLILDGGPCAIGIESTVLDLSDDKPRVLRPGSVTVDMLREVLGEVDADMVVAQAASPGTSPRHYAPQTPATIVDSTQLAARIKQMFDSAVVLCFDSSVVHPPHQAIVMPRDPAAYAARLYDALRQADAMNLAAIIIESPPAGDAAWVAVHDRIRRATSAVR